MLAGADGAIYALRRLLYRDLAPAEINDLLHPIQTALAGYVARFEPRAYTVEPPAKNADQEFRRHVRMVAQGAALLARWLPRLIAARRWRAAWALVSHRVLRWTCGPALLVVLGTNLALLDAGPLYVATLGLQGLFYAVALGGLGAERAGRRLGRLALPHYFCVVSVAGLAGLGRWLAGGAQATWRPTSEAAAGASRVPVRPSRAA